MNKTSVLTVFCAVILATACGGGSGGGNDAGSISIPDGGTEDSGGGGNDAATAPDAFTAGSCELTFAPGNFGALSDACLPRCSSATGSALEACGNDQACAQNALSADTTAPIQLTINDEAMISLTCGACFQLAQLHCFSPACPDETDGVVAACLGGSDMAACNAAATDLNTCASGLDAAGMTALQSCFTSNQGPAGCF